MKKTLALAILGAVAGVATSYGQGTVTFQNYFSSTSPTVKYAASNVPAGKAGLALGGGFAAELGWFNGITTDSSQITLVASSITGFGAVSSAFPNAVADGDLSSGAGWYFGPVVALSGAGAGTVVTLEVVAFNGSSGFNGANTTVQGASGLFQVTLGGGALPPATTIAGPNFTVANVAAVPEPSIFALAGLGAAGLMTLRRNKKA